MKNIRLIILGYVLAIIFHGCDSIMGNSDGTTTSDLEYGDYGTVSWKPLYLKIVEWFIKPYFCYGSFISCYLFRIRYNRQVV